MQILIDLVGVRCTENTRHDSSHISALKCIYRLLRKATLRQVAEVIHQEAAKAILVSDNLRGVVRRQETIVIRTRVRTILPSQGRVTIKTETHRCCSSKACLFVDVVVVVQHHDRLVRTTHTGVTHLAILEAYIRVVVVAAEHIVGLLCRCLLRTTLLWRSENHQRESVLWIKLLLNGCKVAIRVIVHAINIAVTSLTSRNRKSIRPTIIERTRRIRENCTEVIHLVTTRYTCTETLTHLRSTRIDICSTTKATYTILGSGQTSRILLITGCIVHTTPQRPWAVACVGIVETNTIEEYIGIFRVVTSDIESHLAESVRCDIVVQIFRRRKRRWKCWRVGRWRVGVELGKDGIVLQLVVYCIGNNNHRVDILDIILDLNHNVEFLELGSSERELVATRRNTLQLEVSLVVGNRLKCCTLNRYCNISNSHTAIA